MSTTVSPAPAGLPAGALAPAPAGRHAPARGAPVVLAADARAPSDAPAVVARLAAARLGAPVHAIAVVEPHPVYTLGDGAPLLPPGIEAARERDAELATLARLEPVLGPPYATGWRLDVLYGVRARAVADAARERGAALIVVGAAGHRAVDRLLGEDVALQLVRLGGVPVLAVPPTLDRLPRRAVVGVDFGAAGVRAARAALALLDHAAEGGALLTLVHVRSPLEEQHPALAEWASEYDATVADRFERLRALLHADLPGDIADHVTIETRVRAGGVAECLTAAAAEIGADLVAVGTHGPGWVERLFVGSVAQTTLRHAATAVLVTPAPPPAERVRLELQVSGQVTLQRPADWAGALDALTRRDAGRPARLEVADPALGGAAVQAEGYRFVGASWDPHDRRVEIMLGEDPEPRLTHAITGVRSLEIVAEDAARDRALLVEDERGHVVLTFLA